MTLQKRLIIGFMLMTLIALGITGLISTLLINNQFDTYLLSQHKRKVENIMDIASDVLNGSEDITIEDMSIYAVAENYYVEILDESGNILFATPNQIQQHMMGRRLTLAQMRNMPMYSDIAIENKIIESDSREQFLVQVGFSNNIGLSDDANRFKWTLYRSIGLSVMISMGIALLLSMRFSSPVSKSVQNVSESANKIATGHLYTRLSEDHSILELKQLHESMNGMAHILEEQEQLRKGVIDAISHEVKTPLTVLKSHLEAFVDNVMKPTPEKFQNCYDEIIRLEKLLENMDQVNDLNTQSMVLSVSPFELVEEIRSISDILKPQFQKKDMVVELESDEDVMVEMDRYKMRQVMYNLLSNAYKFSEPQSHVTIVIHEKDELVEIEVRNKGLVVPEEEQQRLFESRYRGAGANAYDPHGKGLGLKITKDLVVFMGGEIELIKSDQEYTSFTFRLPKKQGA